MIAQLRIFLGYAHFVIEGEMDNSARERLRACIERSTFSMNSLSKELGFPTSYVSRVLTAKINNPSVDRILAICNALRIDIRWLLTGISSSSEIETIMEDITKPDDIQIAEIQAYISSGKLLN